MESSIIDCFNAIVRRFPSRVAAQDAESSVTYAELALLVDRIAKSTIAATEGRDGPIALLLPSGVTLPAAMLGVLAAGRAYVALDTDFPGERNKEIIADAAACAVISSSDISQEARAFLPHELPIIDVREAVLPTEPGSDLRPGPDDVAAIYYTSGSTGRPKGVAWNHRSLLHWIRVFSQTTQISCTDRTVLLYSPSASASYRAIYGALLNGASVHILSPLSLGVAALAQQIRARGITIYHSVPTLLRRLTENVSVDARLDSVRLVYIGGDRVRWSDVDECRRSFSRDVRIYVTLSGTETGPCIHGIVDDELRPVLTHPPVGRPAPGWTVAIMDDDGQAVPDGKIGNIVVASRFIALGYWQGSGLNIRGFPNDRDDPNARVFSSGNLGRRRADGLIEFVGRADRQFKLHGYRIEPAEVEFALTALHEVSDAAVVVRFNKDGSPLSLVAYVVLGPNIRGLLPRHLQSMLLQRLPRYMIPSRIYLIDDFPRLADLKIDRQALARIDAAQATKLFERQSDPFVDTIARIFESISGIEGATTDDTIATLGGDFLQELDLFAELERRYGFAISDDLVDERATIGSVACWIAEKIAHRSPGDPPP